MRVLRRDRRQGDRALSLSGSPRPSPLFAFSNAVLLRVNVWISLLVPCYGPLLDNFLHKKPPPPLQEEVRVLHGVCRRLVHSSRAGAVLSGGLRERDTGSSASALT